MLWSDERIDKICELASLDIDLASTVLHTWTGAVSTDGLRNTLSIMRDEYERRIAELEAEVAQNEKDKKVVALALQMYKAFAEKFAAAVDEAK